MVKNPEPAQHGASSVQELHKQQPGVVLGCAFIPADLTQGETRPKLMHSVGKNCFSAVRGLKSLYSSWFFKPVGNSSLVHYPDS